MKRRSPQEGAAVVEFAMLASLLVVLLFSIFEFGFLWLSSYYVAGSAREGARVAARISGSESADTAARQAAATNAVNKSLAESPLFARHMSDSGFVTVGYQDGTFSVTADGDTVNVPVTEVTVTVRTATVWEPMLWPLLNGLFEGSFDTGFMREVTQTASFAIE